MEKNIIALLNKNLRVIIPDFGAFIIRQKQPRVVVFNEFLRYNDGLLIDFIIKNEGIDREVAEQQVATFAEDNSKLLAAGKELVIQGLGTLKKDSNGKIVYSPSGENVPIHPEVPEKEELLTMEPAEEPKHIIREGPVTLIRETTASAENHPSRSFKAAAWILMILVINAGVIFLFVYKGKKKPVAETKIQAALVSDSVLYDRLADSVMAAVHDTSIVYSEIPAASSSVQVAKSSHHARYFIVAGCFRDEINADSLVRTLKIKGYKAEKFGRIGNLYAVSYASFDDKEQAMSGLRKIRETIPTAWMTKF
jgi:nucleoid DNA-binding protein